jgi:hypothetical protein
VGLQIAIEFSTKAVGIDINQIFDLVALHQTVQIGG